MQTIETFAVSLNQGDTIIERSETGGVKHRIPVTKFESGRSACCRTKVHVNDSLCYDSNAVVEVLVPVGSEVDAE